MTDFDEFERRLALALRADADQGAPGFDPAQVARAVIAGARRPIRLAPRLWTRPMWARLAVAAAVGALTVGAGLYVAVGGPSHSSAIASPSASSATARPASWTATGSMTTPRLDQSATLLHDGRVLVVGGENKTPPCFTCPDDRVVYSSAELYDPRLGTWARTGSMQSHRGGVALTLLLDGRVLAVGGGTAELYDPRTGTWTSTGTMVFSDQSRGMLLPGGRVLVVGGWADNSPQASAELYDPVSGTWAATAPMLRPRGDPAVALLADGKVLVVGDDGLTGTGALAPNSAELYDPVSGSWTATASMVATAGVSHAIALPDGRALATGYSIVGANSGGGGLSDELYDPVTRTWSVTGTMLGQEVSYQTTLLLSGKVLRTYGSAAELYDPASGTWTTTVSMPTMRWFGTVTLLSDGKVLVAGGVPQGGGSESFALASAELYDPGSP